MFIMPIILMMMIVIIITLHMSHTIKYENEEDVDADILLVWLLL